MQPGQFVGASVKVKHRSGIHISGTISSVNPHTHVLTVAPGMLRVRILPPWCPEAGFARSMQLRRR